MPLYLLEFPSAASIQEELGPLFEDVSRRVSASGGEVIEIQVTADLKRAFVVAEHHRIGRRQDRQAGCQLPGRMGLPARSDDGPLSRPQTGEGAALRQRA